MGYLQARNAILAMTASAKKKGLPWGAAAL
jgi:hypothetical protein